MSSNRRRQQLRVFRTLRITGFVVSLGSLAPFVMGNEIAAVTSRTFNGYTRSQLADGSYRPETYAFVNVGPYLGTTAADGIDTMPFIEIANALLGPLSKQGYLPVAPGKDPDLMIFVAWGTTESTENKSSEKPVVTRDLLEARNAAILGFGRDLRRTEDLKHTVVGRDLLDEFHPARYFVVLKACDFQTARLHKQRKILWETRFSIHQKGSNFAAELPGIALQASTFFGRESYRIVHATVPEGQVILGDAKVIEKDEVK